MREPVAAQRGAAPRASGGWRIRGAATRDVAALAAAVGSLLDELGGRRPAARELEREARAALADPSGCTLLVAEVGGDGAAGRVAATADDLVGVLSASWQRAVHVPGRYATIQDLWVERSWRSRGVGAGLVAGLEALARARGVARIEVGLPRESFAAIAATESFYRRHGFEHLGPRMRRLL